VHGVRRPEEHERGRDERAPAEDDGGDEREEADRDQPDADEERVVARLCQRDRRDARGAGDRARCRR